MTPVFLKVLVADSFSVHRLPILGGLGVLGGELSGFGALIPLDIFQGLPHTIRAAFAEEC